MKVISINPATGLAVKEFEAFDKNQITAALDKARKAQFKWETIKYKEKEELFIKLKDNLKNNLDKLCNLGLEEVGKLRPDFEAEVFGLIDGVDYYLNAFSQLKEKKININSAVFTDTETTLEYKPFGVIGLIMPWNFPLYSPGMFLITSLLTGNSVMYKPSEYSTSIAFETKRIFVESGFDQDLIQIIPGAEETGKTLIDAGVDKIFFVGSVDAGTDIIKRAAPTPVQVEMGGNSSAIILEDSDLEFSSNAVTWGATYFAGQDCVGIKRVFVHENIFDKFIDNLKSKVKSLRPGIDYSPYIREEALQVAENRMNDAISKGAILHLGGEKLPQPGFWLTPAIIELNNQQYELVSEETFGNVIPIQKFTSIEDVLELNNKTKYGLSTSIFTSNIDKAKEISRQIESGMVFINDPFIELPGWDHWTGWKSSGFGTTESKLMQCMKAKVISIHSKEEPRVFWYPY